MLRAGTETGSLINHLYSRGRVRIPAIGDGATILHWTDRSAGTVVAVRETPKRVYVTVQGDHAKRVDTNGMSEAQAYAHTPNPNGGRQTFTFRKTDNGLVKLGKHGPGVSFGHRSTYHDFSF